jgi:hypothetical protein
MSGYEQRSEVPSADAAAAPAPTARERQRTLEAEIRELKAEIRELKANIALDEAKADRITIDEERVEFRRAIAEDKKERNLLEARRDILEAQIEQLSTVAGDCSPTSCLPLRPRIGLSRRVLRALLLLREFDSPFHLCARTATRPTRRFARVVRSPSVRVHYPSLCIDGALSLPQRVRAASHLVHAPRGAADCGRWTLSYLVPTLALAHRLACLAGHCARSSCFESLTSPSGFKRATGCIFCAALPRPLLPRHALRQNASVVPPHCLQQLASHPLAPALQPLVRRMQQPPILGP